MMPAQSSNMTGVTIKSIIMKTSLKQEYVGNLVPSIRNDHVHKVDEISVPLRNSSAKI